MKPISLNIPKPCTEKWNNFSPTLTGGFCSSCSKVVTDFTVMTDEQILTQLSNSSQHVCGRFRPDQLKTYTSSVSPSIRPGFTLLRAGIIGLFILLISKPGNARLLQEKSRSEITFKSSECVEESLAVNQTTIITGIVRDKTDKWAIPGVNVLLKGSTQGTTTDANGRFELHANVEEGDVIQFTFIGYEMKEYRIPKSGGEALEINVELYMDVTIMGEIAVSTVYENPPSGMKTLWNKVKAWF